MRSAAVLAVVLALVALTGCSDAVSPSSPSPPTDAVPPTWTQVASGENAPPDLASQSVTETWYSITAPDPAHAFMVGIEGLIFATNDAGASWREQHAARLGTASTGSAQVFAIDRRHCWGVGANGRIVATADGGSTWTEQHSPAAALLDVAFCDPLHGWAVGGSSIVHTTDGGRTWAAQSAPLGALGARDGFTAVACIDPEHAWAVRLGLTVDGGAASSTSTVYATSDGGARWRRLWSGPAAARHLEFVDARHGWLAGGGVWATSDGGTTWSRQMGAGERVNDVAFVDALHGWASDFNTARGPAILHTTDGGRSWQRRTLRSLGLASDRTAEAWSIAFSDAGHGWAVGDNGEGQLVGRYAPQ